VACPEVDAPVVAVGLAAVAVAVALAVVAVALAGDGMVVVPEEELDVSSPPQAAVTATIAAMATTPIRALRRRAGRWFMTAPYSERRFAVRQLRE